MMIKEKEWTKSKESALDCHRKEVLLLEGQIEELRTELIQTKEKLDDAVTVSGLY